MGGLWCVIRTGKGVPDDQVRSYRRTAYRRPAPAFAAEYFIVRGPNKKCQIVEKRPTEKTMVVIGDKAYVTRDEAQKQMAVVCKE